jgi:hypothetical protein
MNNFTSKYFNSYRSIHSANLLQLSFEGSRLEHFTLQLNLLRIYLTIKFVEKRHNHVESM